MFGLNLGVSIINKVTIILEAQCINYSHLESTIKHRTIFLGLQYIQGLESSNNY